LLPICWHTSYTTTQGEQSFLGFTKVTLNFKNMNTETNRILKLEKIGAVQTELVGPVFETTGTVQ
jgi:hypothetical protein